MDNNALEESVRTLCVIDTAYLFKVPPRGPTGYSAKGLKENPLMNGRLEVLAKGEECVILVKNKATDKPYVTCPVRYKGPPAYEATFDSSRYFVLRIENLKTGKHAFAGLGFNKREQALDFKVALQDFEKQLDREKNGRSMLAQPTRDLSIKDGEKIKIKLKSTVNNTGGNDDGGNDSSSRRRRKPKSSNNSGGTISGPKATGGRRRRRKNNNSSASNINSGNSNNAGISGSNNNGSSGADLLSLDGLSFGNNNTTNNQVQQQQATTTNAIGNDPFDMGGFNNPPPNSSNNNNNNITNNDDWVGF
jgi:adaptin ear-binding coat-associated protein 1/2